MRIKVRFMDDFLEFLELFWGKCGEKTLIKCFRITGNIVCIEFCGI